MEYFLAIAMLTVKRNKISRVGSYHIICDKQHDSF